MYGGRGSCLEIQPPDSSDHVVSRGNIIGSTLDGHKYQSFGARKLSGIRHAFKRKLPPASESSCTIASIQNAP